jgi:calcium-dependent protein kinase
LTADDALGASWLNRRYSATVRNPHEEEIEIAQQSMFRYAGYSKLKRVALMVIAHKSSSQEIGILRKVFQKYDTKRDGQLSFEEFKAAIAESGINESKHQEIFDAVVSTVLHSYNVPCCCCKFCRIICPD